MPDPFMRADTAIAIMAGQALFEHIKTGDWRDHLLDVSLEATTELNFISQMVLQNKASGPVMGAKPAFSYEGNDWYAPENVQSRLPTMENFLREIKAPQAAGPAGGPLGDVLVQVLSPVIDAAVSALKAWLASLAKPKHA